MVQTLPTGEIKLCDDVIHTPQTINISYIYTIDVKYNQDLEQKTKKCPFFPEKTNIEQFTDWQNDTEKKNDKPNEKCMLKLTDKDDYVIDDELLDWFLDQGLWLKTITIKKIFTI